jgi:hypothetical protein
MAWRFQRGGKSLDKMVARVISIGAFWPWTSPVTCGCFERPEMKLRFGKVQRRQRYSVGRGGKVQDANWLGLTEPFVEGLNSLEMLQRRVLQVQWIMVEWAVPVFHGPPSPTTKL